mgnify:CR=1 FL=1|tara:strand:- start:413 stop:613 length:201 start_codon:yes stop_codon:yes gene_type:complete
MRFIAIENNGSTDKVIINADHICSMFLDGGAVVITTADGKDLRTKFTDVDHAVDFIQRASSVSLGR